MGNTALVRSCRSVKQEKPGTAESSQRPCGYKHGRNLAMFHYDRLLVIRIIVCVTMIVNNKLSKNDKNLFQSFMFDPYAVFVPQKAYDNETK
jgi:hypothetical protein